MAFGCADLLCRLAIAMAMVLKKREVQPQNPKVHNTKLHALTHARTHVHVHTPTPTPSPTHRVVGVGDVQSDQNLGMYIALQGFHDPEGVFSPFIVE